MDRREVARPELVVASESLLAAARDLLQFLPGFADNPGDCGTTCIHISQNDKYKLFNFSLNTMI